MKEEFIYYLWENRLLSLDLRTTDGDEIKIVSVGNRNYDSGADFVTVDITGGGIDSIRVKDNGTGMTKEDLLSCAKPHSTSKISS